MENRGRFSTLQVGEWTVEPGLNRLSAAGKSVKLEPKAMVVLLFLAEQQGRVASREALLSAVWPGVVVGDDSLTQVIIKLRKALGDAAEQPAYIETISKGGYRLIAPVARRERSARRWRPWIAGAGGLGALLLAASAILWDETAVAPGSLPGTSTEAARAAQLSVAIRPFEALGGDAQAALLARAITEDLATDLSKVAGLSVISGTPASGQARYLVSGSVSSTGDRLRLHVRLADAQSGEQLWSERYDRPLAGLFAMQEELGPKIVQTLPAKVSEAELRRVAQRYTRDLEAYAQFQRGQAALLVRQRSENERAREMFRRAIARDAAFARAYAGLALTYAAEFRNQWTPDGAAALQRAFELARTAHQIDPDLPETYWVLAFVHLERREHEQALQHLGTSVRLNPSFADGYALMGGIHTYIGRPAASVELVRTAMRLNPQAGHLYFLILGRAYLFLGDLEQARVNLDHALSRNPENLEAHVYLAAVHAAAGDKAAAAWKAEEIRVLQPGFSSRAWLETYPMTDAAQKARLSHALRALGL